MQRGHGTNDHLPTADEPVAAGDGALHRNGASPWLAAVHPDAQADRPALTPTVEYDLLLRLGRELLYAIGEDPDREGLRETPRRWASWWREFIEYDAGTLDTTFAQIESNQMVIVSGMRVYSLCEHHLLPFWCDVTVGYIPDGQVLGLSKFGRIAHKHAHRLQVQERLVSGIASEIEELARTPHVAVLATGEHLCMTMRGVKTQALMTSTAQRGAFQEEAAFARFLQLAGR